MNVVDSSGWLEYFADGVNADFFASAIEDVDQLIVPSVSIYEVFKRIRQQTNENDALDAIAIMYQGQLVDLDSTLALNAAQLSIALKLPMADSIILATVRAHQATLWTQDADFENIDDVRYIEKQEIEQRTSVAERKRDAAKAAMDSSEKDSETNEEEESHKNTQGVDDNEAPEAVWGSAHAAPRSRDGLHGPAAARDGLC